MKVVYEANHIIDAHLVRHALEQENIPVYINGEALLGGLGEIPACGLITVCVPDSAELQARAIIDTLPLLV